MGPLKSQLLVGRTPNAYKEDHSTCPVGGICLVPIPLVPHTRNKKAAIFAQLRVVFESQWRGATVLGRRRDETSGSSSPGAELKLYHGFLKSPPMCWEIWGRFCGPFGTKSEKKIRFQWVNLRIRGQKFPFNFFSAVTRLRYQRRLWFCYQIWPISIRWLICGFLSLCNAQIALSPQVHYHTYINDINTIPSQIEEQTGNYIYLLCTI